MPPSSISLANRSTPATPASVVGGVVASFQSIALTARQATKQTIVRFRRFIGMEAVSVVSLVLGIDCFAMGDVRGQLLGDQYKGRIWLAVPGRDHGKRDVVRRGRGEGKAAGASDTADGCNHQE